jgi:di/tricarboxylate transporter
MTPAILIVLAALAIAVALMVTEVLRADVVALLLAVTLALTGVITVQEAFSGLSHSAVVTVLAIFVLTHGLYRTGGTRRIGLALHRLAGDHPSRLLLFTMLSGAGLSLFMNNIAAAAVLLPPTMDLSRRARVSPSKLLMPLAFAASLGGTATLLATSNILVSAVLRDQGLAPYGLLDFAPVGLPMIAVGVGYMLLVGRRLLPTVSPAEQLGRARRLRKELTEVYALEERLCEVHIPARSPLVGKSIAASRIGERLGLSVLAIWRDDQPPHMAPGPDYVLRGQDTLLVAGRPERVQQLTGWGAEVLETPTWNNSLSTDRVALLEVILAPRGRASAQTLKELHFREKYGLSVVALWRRGRPYRTDVGDIPLQFGDALLVHGRRGRIAMLRADPDFLVLTEPSILPRARKAWLAVAIMALTLLVVATNLLPIAEAMMLGALAVVIAGCLTMDEAYRAVEWKAIFLIAGMLPVGVALDKSGAAQWLAQLLVTWLSDWGPLALGGGLFLLATMLTQVISGQAAAVVLAPIAVAAARQVGAEPRAIAMAAALGCSMTFLSPTAHPVNVFMMGPGGYRFRDFLRVGLPMTLLLFLTLLVVLPVFWPLR